MENHTYNVSISWKEERKGELSSPEIEAKIEVATPLPFDKGIVGFWSPEHLLTASVSSCFMTTFFAIAAYSK
jgi:organic hydroperoxide reductase OsmC/OhrA